MNKIVSSDMENIINSSCRLEILKNKTVLITGAYGMLPSYMAFLLLYLNNKRGYGIDIIPAVRDAGKWQASVSRFFPEFSPPEPFITDLKAPLDICGDIDYIIHAASPASPHIYGDYPVNVIEPNVLGTYNLLKLAVEKKSSGFLYFSSCEVYGKTAAAEVTETDFGPSDPLELRGCYGESKRMGENLCGSFRAQFSVPVKIVRPAHTYGPTTDIVNDERVFAEFIGNVVRGENILMKSRGDAIRSFCYISDATVGFFKILLEGKIGEAYNLSNERAAVSVKELAETIAALYPHKGLKVTAAERKAGESYMENRNTLHPVFVSDKLKSLGWKPVYGIKEGFKRTVESFLERI